MRRSIATSIIISAVITVTASLLGVAPSQADTTGTGAPSRGPHDTVDATTRHYAVVRPGGKVRERVRFHLGATADVFVGIRDSAGRYVRGSVKFGTLSPGWHYWTWAGARNGGAPAPDGHYRVTVHATFKASGYTTQDRTGAFVHRRYHPGTLTSTYSTLYPRSTTLRDSTTLEVRPPEMVKATMRIRNSAGKVVFTRAQRRLHAYQRVQWAGRDGRGRPLPAGTYHVKVSGTDADGLTGATKALAVKVSAERLVTRTRTVTVPPTSNWGLTYPRGCNGCSDYPECGTVTPSDRFTQDGALSYDSGPGCGDRQGQWVAATHHRLALHEVAPRGYGTVTVSMFGGPTTPGAADQGQLRVNPWTTGTTVLTGPDTNDHTTTAPAVPIGVIVEEDDVEEGTPGFQWQFFTREGASYDVASFTLKYTFLTPQR